MDAPNGSEVGVVGCTSTRCGRDALVAPRSIATAPTATTSTATTPVVVTRASR
jgi:hypothetical protein